MATVTVTETLYEPNHSTPISGARVMVRLVASTSDDAAPGWQSTSDYTIGDASVTTTNQSGIWSMSLEPNANITPSGSVYRIDYKFPNGGKPGPVYVTVLSSPSTQRVEDILDSMPTSISTALDLIGTTIGDLAVYSGSAWGRLAKGTEGSILTTRSDAGSDLTWVADKFFDVRTYGATGDGSTDDTTAIQTTISTAAATGGVVYFPAGTYKITSSLSINNNGATPPRQRPLRFLGVGSDQRGAADSSGSPYSGSILMFNSASTPGCIDTRGDGMLEVAGLTFWQNGTAHTVPYIHTTNTTLHVHHCAFLGHSTKTTTGCDQDGIVLGGTTTTLDGSSTAAFQGYGTVIENNWFNRIRRMVYLRTYANGVMVQNNTAWWKCGGSAAIELDGGSDNCVGNVFAHNLIEAGGYTNIFVLTKATRNNFLSNNLFDGLQAGGAFYRFTSSANYNMVLDGYRNDSYTWVADSAGRNTLIGAAQSVASVFTEPVQFSNSTGATFRVANFVGGNNATVIQPADDTVEGAKLLKIVRSAADDTNAGGEVFSVSQGAQLNLQNSSNAINSFYFSGAGMTWAPTSGAGGTFKIDTGTGGSNLDLEAAALRFLNFSDSVEKVRLRLDTTNGSSGCIQFNGTAGPVIYPGTGAPEGVVTAPAGSLYLRTDGSSGASIYHKVSGSGNTGWAAL